MMVLTSALVLAPLWKKHPQPMKPAHTRTKPLKGPSARNAQMPPRTAILKERAITCVMTYLPCDALWWSGTADALHRRNRDFGSPRRGSLIYTSFCRYGLSEDHITATPPDINRFRIAALS